MNDNVNQKEFILTQNYTRWFKEEYQYLELFDDTDTAGSDPFDSAGLVGDRLTFIEFKHSVSFSQVFYAGSKGSSIEKKIGQLLSNLYQGKKDRLTQAVKKHYHHSITPHLILAVNNVSENTLQELKIMLDARTVTWQFSCEIHQWIDDKAVTIYQKDCSTRRWQNDDIRLPYFPSTAPKRNPKLTYENLLAEMELIGHRATFESLWKGFQNMDASFTYNITNVNVKFRKHAPKAIFGIWPSKSNTKNGIRLTLDLNQVQQYFNPSVQTVHDLGLKRNRDKVGFLGYNVFLDSEEMVALFLGSLKEGI